MKLPFFNELEKAQNILIAGAGGGFDVFCGLPLYFWLKKAGKTVHLANLSAGALGFCDAENPTPALWRVTARTAATKYFPEMHLSAWLTKRYGETPIFAMTYGEMIAGRIPSFTSDKANFESRVAIAISQTDTRPTPPPMAAP